MIQAVLLLLVPVVLFSAAGILMMRATGRARFRQRRKQPASKPLNFRFRGYDATAAIEYWRWLGADGLAAELRFLKADMVFPLWYGGLMLGSLCTAWRLLGAPMPGWVLVLPVLIAVTADWIENLVHMRQIREFTAGRTVSARQVRIASLATSAKLLFFWLATLLMAVLAGRIAWAGAN